MLTQFLSWNILVIFILLNSSALANDKTDPHNTYQFNRKNYFEKNGKINQSPWFEWWYYKVVLPEKQKAFYFVYGVVNPWDKKNDLAGTRAYVEIGSFSDNLIMNQIYHPKNFSASYATTHVQVGADNFATQNSLVGSITNAKGESSSWSISVNRKWTFNATGWATGKNLTQIEWYPAQADARCSGEIILNGKKEVFESAPCYQDRNWGTHFPDWWAWVVSNEFENSPGTTLAIGGGKTTINETGNKVEAFAIGFRYKNQDFAWRPNSGDLILFQVNFGKWEITGINDKYRIKISAYAPREKFMDLQFVTPGGRVFHDYEALHGEVKVELYENIGTLVPIWRLIESFISHHAGLEYGSFDELK
jgi:tocopherol cyclase